MNYITKKRIESKACPGVAFTVRTLSEGRRIEISMKAGELLAEIDMLRRQAAVVGQKAAALLDDARVALQAGDSGRLAAIAANEDVAEATRLGNRIRSLERDQVFPLYVAALLASVDGLEIDGSPATAAQWREYPPELYSEIVAAVRLEIGLTGDESGNSQSPGTSHAGEAGQTSNTTAESADVQAGGVTGDVPASIPVP